MSDELKKAQAFEKETVVQFKGLQKKFDAKVAECESLVFRIKHMEENFQPFLDAPKAVLNAAASG